MYLVSFYVAVTAVNEVCEPELGRQRGGLGLCAWVHVFPRLAQFWSLVSAKWVGRCLLTLSGVNSESSLKLMSLSTECPGADSQSLF